MTACTTCWHILTPYDFPDGKPEGETLHRCPECKRFVLKEKLAWLPETQKALKAIQSRLDSEYQQQMHVTKRVLIRNDNI